MDKIGNIKRKSNPREIASFFSNISFLYIYHLFNKSRKGVEEDDIYEITKSLNANHCGELLSKEWENQRSKSKTPSLIKTILICYWKRYLFVGIIQFTFKIMLTILSPLVLAKFIQYFSPNPTGMTQGDVYFYGAMILFMSILKNYYIHNCRIAMKTIIIEIQAAVTTLVYKKSLKLSYSALDSLTIGKIISLISKDIEVFEPIANSASEFWMGLIQIWVLFYLIYNKIGEIVWISALFIAVLTPILFIIAKVIFLRRTLCNKKTDKRLHVIQQVLSSIRIIKIYTWEKFFEKWIAKARGKEIKHLQIIRILRDLTLYLGAITTRLAIYTTFSIYLRINHELTAEITYYVIDCFENLDDVVCRVIPNGMNFWGELMASIKRFELILNADETTSQQKKEFIFEKPIISLQDVSVKQDNKVILNKVSLTLNSGLNLIIGPVGSGKSTLLKTILNETQFTNGKILTQGTISYASQEPWIFPSTIRQNILFGEYFDDLKYGKILDVCSLELDLKSFAENDLTNTGDSGVNLSKGQQCRINLARAVYRDADIYLLDDCLASVDTQVRDHIVKHCLKKYLTEKLCILTAHNIDLIYQANNVTFIDKGQVSFSGKPYDIPKEILKIYSVENYHSNDLTDNNRKDDIEEIDYPIHPYIINKNAIERDVYYEEKRKGGVTWKTYKKYLEGGGKCLYALIFVIYLAGDGIFTYTEKLISSWVNLNENITKIRRDHIENSTELVTLEIERDQIFGTYTVLMITSMVVIFMGFVLHVLFSYKMSIRLHKQMVSSILGASFVFFDTNLIGNILNRFSRDIIYVDELLGYTENDYVRIILNFMGTLTLISSVNKTFLVLSLVFLLFYILLCYYLLPIVRDLRRLNGTTRSPVIGYLNSTLEGLMTIRARNNQEILIKEFNQHLNLNVSVYYTMESAFIACVFYMGTVATVFVACIISRFLFIEEDLPGNVGLAISKAFIITIYFEQVLTGWMHLESNMTCFERCLDYTTIRQENRSGDVIEDWPKDGKIEFKNINLLYRLTDNLALQGLSFITEPKEKIGLVGRTGAGKSSVISALLRFYDYNGNIFIDNVNIKSLTIHHLRSKIAVIPQDPVIFSISVRENLDPGYNLSDSELWSILKSVNLHNFVVDLDSNFSQNLSTGQKQLLCLARAMVNKARILILDEATANIDDEMGNFVQSKIKELFENCTVLTIAHRLHTVLESDRIMVLSGGELKEFDSPRNLLSNETTYFYRMVETSGLLNRVTNRHM